MPTYDYVCTLCDNQFEKNVAIDERDGNVQCPKCTRYFTERKITFKGLTWAPTAGGMR